MYFIKGTAINSPFRYDCRNEIERDHAFSMCHGCMYQYNNNEFFQPYQKQVITTKYAFIDDINRHSSEFDYGYLQLIVKS